MVPAEQLKLWSIADSADLYDIDTWSQGYFHINAKGHVAVSPVPNGVAIDLCDMITRMESEGIRIPLILRFPDIARDRVKALTTAFRRSIAEYGYTGTYRAVFPIKVNQQRHVIQGIAEAGEPFGLGMEVGSKPELLIALTMLSRESGLIICNGYKDHDYIETALLATQMGFRICIVLERTVELDMALAASERLGIEPMLGIRARLSAKSHRGKWSDSGGDRAKFGLNIVEISEAIATLRAAGKLHTLELLHYHIGSQISAIRDINTALRESTHLFVQLRKSGAPLSYFDLGGGLAVDYDGSRTNYPSSANYNVQEYANGIVDALFTACTESNQPHPDIISESGRWLSSHQSMIVMEVLDRKIVPQKAPVLDDPENVHRVILDLQSTLTGISPKNVQESWHDILYWREEAMTLFNYGLLTIDERSAADRFFWAACQRIFTVMQDMDHVPEELEHLERILADTLYCNISIFQSLPDTWAIGQIFPIMPLQRLNEEPTRRAILADMTCDSDGRIDRFCDPKNIRRVLEVHEPRADERYFLGVFLSGAYQEILGDLHNLFGDTDAVHISLNEDGTFETIDFVEGDSIREVLTYVQYQPDSMLAQAETICTTACSSGRATVEQADLFRKHFSDMMNGYTYLVPKKNTRG